MPPTPSRQGELKKRSPGKEKCLAPAKYNKNKTGKTRAPSKRKTKALPVGLQAQEAKTPFFHQGFGGGTRGLQTTTPHGQEHKGRDRRVGGNRERWITAPEAKEGKRTFWRGGGKKPYFYPGNSAPQMINSGGGVGKIHGGRGDQPQENPGGKPQIKNPGGEL